MRSKQRVADHGEVFTPAWMVEAMLDLVKDETERIDSRFLEPACGTGNFLVQVLRRKLAAVELKFGKSDFERRHYALLGLMCIYGIELLDDNVAECRDNLLEIFADVPRPRRGRRPLPGGRLRARRRTSSTATRSRCEPTSVEPITFAEWGYLGKGKFQRRDFRLDILTQIVVVQRGRHALRRPRQARDLHADEDLPAPDGEGAGAMSAAQAGFALRGRNPDVLTCIANLSNDEVFTPPEFANKMLDTLAEAWAADNDGANIWADPTVTFLDPFTKSGVFLREITSRLTEGLEDEIPDLQERVDHILTKQVFGIGITHLTSLLARRSVYCSKWANGPHSIAKSFATEEGNIWFERMEHTWVGGTEWVLTADETATRSRSSPTASASTAAPARGPRPRRGLETHAYAFIHTDDIKARIAELFGDDMQFDVIIGNPPYQLGNGWWDGRQSHPDLPARSSSRRRSSTRASCMVIPSRWFAGGQGSRRVPRARCLATAVSARSSTIPNAADVFPAWRSTAASATSSGTATTTATATSRRP